MWLAGLLGLTFIAALLAWRSGPSVAVGATVLLAHLFPKWLMVDVFGVPADLRVAGTMAALGIYCLHPRAVFRTPLCALDFTMILMLVLHAASDTSHSIHWDWGILLRIYGEWMVPYFAGRVAVMQWRHVRQLSPYAIGLLATLIFFAVVESLGQWNLFEALFGIAETDGPPRGLTRWGVQRAFGPTKNPIYLGTLMVLLTPWVIFAAYSASKRTGNRWWLGAPILVLLGMICPGSRAPLAAVIPFAYAALAAWKKEWKVPLAVIGILAVGLLSWQATAVIDFLSTWGEKAPEGTHKIVLDEKEVDYSGTKHRLYLLDMYGAAMQRGGLLGYGTDATSTFPPQVPLGSTDPSAMRRLWCVDNAFILIVLRFGYFGAVILALAGIFAAWNYWRLADQESRRRRAYATSMCGLMVAMQFILLTVWMPHDFGFLYLWTMAAGAGLLTNQDRDLEN